MKHSSSFAKQRYIQDLQLLRSNMQILPIANPRKQINSSAHKTDAPDRINFRVPSSLNYQNLAFSFQKQNNKKLSFSNLKKSLKSSSSQSNNNCGVHPTKMAKYKEADSNRFYCKQCAIQVASKGIKVEEIAVGTSMNVMGLMDECSLKINSTTQILAREFQKVKNSVNSEIRVINQHYNSIIEKISEMQIKDLLVFETCLGNAEKQYNLAREDIELSHHELASIPKGVNESELSMICNVISSKMEKLVSMKFQVNKQDPAFKLKMDNISQYLDNLDLPQGNSKVRTDISQVLKSNSTFQSQKRKKEEIKASKSIEDTPESLKKKCSVSEKSILQLQELKTIEFCESITNLSEVLAQEQEALEEARADGRGSGTTMEYFRHRYCQNSEDDD